MLALFLASLWSLSYYAIHILHQDMEKTLSDQQFSTVSVIAANVNNALSDRLKALETVAEMVTPTLLNNDTALQDFLDRLPLLQNNFNAGVIAYQANGNAIAEVPQSARRVGTNYMDIDTIAAALREGESTVGSPVIGKKLMAPVFGMTVPIRDEQQRVIGALSGVTNLGSPNFLDQVTQNRYSKTGGYMLVAPQSRLIVTATDKRRIMETLPPTGANALVDQFFLGYEGSGVTVNPLGVEVLASAKTIPLGNWYVAVELPTTEAFAPIHNLQRRMLMATVVLTILAGALTWWTLRHHLNPLVEAAGQLAIMSSSTHPLQPLSVTRPDEIGQVIGGFNRLLLTLTQREEALKRSEGKFLDILENVEAFLYLKDTQGRYTFANRTMRRMCGVSMAGIVGKTDDAFFDQATVVQLQANDRKVLEQGITLKTDETVFNLATGTTSIHLSVKLPLRNEIGDIYALCGISTDITDLKMQEARRLADEAAHRGALVREVHHRIKNNLQGITGMLRQFTASHPESTDVINQAISQVDSIAVLHGLQGRKSMETVRLCELTSAIAGDVQAVWRTPIHVDIPSPWVAGVVAESEAVPMALVLNELIVNAVKHGGKAHGQVQITLRKGDRPELIRIAIENAGQLRPKPDHVPGHHIGLHLVKSLMPRNGVTLTREQHSTMVVTRLDVEPPVVTLEQPETYESEKNTNASTPLAG